MQTMPDTARLRTTREFRMVLDGGVSQACRHVVVYARERHGDDAHSTRFGMIVSGRVGNAVQRNRIKRHLREIFRTMPDASRPENVDLVVIARQGSLGVDQMTLRQSVDYCLRKIGNRPAKDRTPDRSRSGGTAHS